MNKENIISLHEKEFERWDHLFSSTTDLQRESVLYSNRTLKDELAHLWIWQRLAESRLQAAIDNSEPNFAYLPEWFDPLAESDEMVDRLNNWIYKKFLDTQWDDLYSSWKQTYTHVLNMARKIPATQYEETGVYDWLASYSLMDVLHGSYKHYHDAHWQHVKHLSSF